MMAAQGFQIVESDEDEQAQPKQAKQEHAAAFTVMMMALATLSKRVLIAVSDLFTLITVGLVFWLYFSITNPNLHQLISLGMFSIFILMANWVVRRK
jgi:hypothetical protein